MQGIFVNVAFFLKLPGIYVYVKVILLGGKMTLIMKYDYVLAPFLLVSLALKHSSLGRHLR